MVQPLAALGLVSCQSLRFNTYKLSSQGGALLQLACADYHPLHKKDVSGALEGWVRGKDSPWKGDYSAMFKCLDPETPLPAEACVLLRGLLKNDDRRRALYALWEHPQRLAWEQRPDCLTPDHWLALHAGACLFAVRDAGLSVLNIIESQLGQSKSRKVKLTELTDNISVEALRSAAQSFLALNYDQTFIAQHNDVAEAEKFCQECNNKDVKQALRSLVLRDGKGLCLEGDMVVPGIAFHGDMVIADGENAEDGNAKQNSQKGAPLLQWPDNISFRVWNLCDLFEDLSTPKEK